MNRIGILTLYKNSCNYGGLLQAYALTYALNQMGFDAKQILLGDYSTEYVKRSVLVKIREHGLRYALELLEKKTKNRANKSEVSENDLKLTRQLCEEFRNNIPHTEVVNEDNLYMLNDIFDVFIVGSDQVWNPKWMRDVYLLKFAYKKKLSYAASMARMDFSKYEQKQLGSAIQSFSWVSVRESDAVDYLNKEFGTNAEVVLDPTLLLDKSVWEQEENYQENFGDLGNYIFCYFLNGTQEKREYAQKLAEKYHFKLVFPIWVGEKIKYDDETKGEIFLYNVGPREWLWLLHNAKVVLTDSFHGTVFSIVYEKQFYHFLRDEKKGSNMNSRIFSLMSMFKMENRIYDKKGNFDNTEINYNDVTSQLRIMRSKSLALLKENIEDKN